MKMVCLDLEGVLVPEIWIAVADSTGIPELRLTTRDVPDYDALMNKRIEILKERNLSLKDIQNVISGMQPLEGAQEFLDYLRANTQIIILSDTFEQFASPLMRRLGWPTLFCNTLVVDRDNMITGYRLRQQNGKMNAVRSLSSIGFKILASGDSYNDLSMLKEAARGVLFRPPVQIVKDHPEFPAVESYDALIRHVDEFLNGKRT